MLYTRHDMLGRGSLKGESDIPVDASVYLPVAYIMRLWSDLARL